MARARNTASTLVNHYAMSFEGSSRDFASIKAPTLVAHATTTRFARSHTDMRCATRFPARRC